MMLMNVLPHLFLDNLEQGVHRPSKYKVSRPLHSFLNSMFQWKLRYILMSCFQPHHLWKNCTQGQRNAKVCFIYFGACCFWFSVHTLHEGDHACARNEQGLETWRGAKFIHKWVSRINWELDFTHINKHSLHYLLICITISCRVIAFYVGLESLH